ncbi:asparaginase-domain-containing protein [Poronia punctata]|nr:asparaginase-domain-containing protein [Poronia punctata]
MPLLLQTISLGLSLIVPSIFANNNNNDNDDGCKLLLNNSPGLPMVINTWGGDFTAATDAAYTSILNNKNTTTTTALDAVEIGCSTCEANQCDGTVGYGGSPDENCETTLDAMIMDGKTMNSGSVAGLRRIKNAISVARAVMEHTSHTMLAGDLATEFAISNGFVAENLTTEASAAKCAAWRAESCQPNYRVNVMPDPSVSCGPYTPAREDDVVGKARRRRRRRLVGHDTISLIVLDGKGGMAAGTSTNGAAYKVPGRVGDGPIIGSGSYVDSDVGGCGATGDGDIMMRFLPCYQAVESMRRGMSPKAAAEDAVWRMVRKYPDVSSGIVVVNTKGEHAGAGSGWNFTYAYRGGDMKETVVIEVPPVNGKIEEEL